MSADLLRRAAAVLRERAEAATPGPWTLYDRGIGWEINELPQPHDGLTFVQADAMYIAVMHPGVALALADWLSREADLMIENEDLIVRMTAKSWELTANESSFPQAIAVARAILGEPDA